MTFLFVAVLMLDVLTIAGLLEHHLPARLERFLDVLFPPVHDQEQ